jgi:RNA polymerase sigma factor (sigma-70 family)
VPWIESVEDPLIAVRLKMDTENPLTFETASISDGVDVRDLPKFLNRAIRELPQAQQEVIDLTFFKGMSQREIARKRQIALGTVETRLQLAQRKLHNYLMPMQSKI